MTKLTRTDCKRDNVQVYCPNATLIGFGIRKCKRGSWVHFKNETRSEAECVGRAIGRVICEGKVHIEVATAAANFAHVFIRWVAPEDVLEVRRSPPRTVFDFFASGAGWDADLVFKALEYGVSDMRDQLTLDNAIDENAERQREAHAAGRTKAGNDISGI